MAALTRRRVSVLLVPCRGSGKSPAGLRGRRGWGHGPPLPCCKALANPASREKQVKSITTFPVGNWQARGNIISLIWKRSFSGKYCPWNFYVCLFYFVLIWNKLLPLSSETQDFFHKVFLFLYGLIFLPPNFFLCTFILPSSDKGISGGVTAG